MVASSSLASIGTQLANSSVTVRRKRRPRRRKGALGSAAAIALADLDSPIPHEIIAAVAYELWSMHGGNDILNWLEAERLLLRVAATRRDFAGASHSEAVACALAAKCESARIEQ